MDLSLPAKTDPTNHHEGTALIRLQGLPPGIPKGSPMWLILFRVFMVALLAHAGYFYSPIPGQPWAGASLGVLAALFASRSNGPRASRWSRIPGMVRAFHRSAVYRAARVSFRLCAAPDTSVRGPSVRDQSGVPCAAQCGHRNQRPHRRIASGSAALVPGRGVRTASWRGGERAQGFGRGAVCGTHPRV